MREPNSVIIHNPNKGLLVLCKDILNFEPLCLQIIKVCGTGQTFII